MWSMPSMTICKTPDGRRALALYNGLIAYVAMSAMFGDERLIRRRMMCRVSLQ